MGGTASVGITAPDTGTGFSAQSKAWRCWDGTQTMLTRETAFVTSYNLYQVALLRPKLEPPDGYAGALIRLKSRFWWRVTPKAFRWLTLPQHSGSTNGRSRSTRDDTGYPVGHPD